MSQSQKTVNVGEAEVQPKAGKQAKAMKKDGAAKNGAKTAVESHKKAEAAPEKGKKQKKAKPAPKQKLTKSFKVEAALAVQGNAAANAQKAGPASGKSAASPFRIIAPSQPEGVEKKVKYDAASYGNLIDFLSRFRDFVSHRTVNDKLIVDVPANDIRFFGAGIAASPFEQLASDHVSAILKGGELPRMPRSLKAAVPLVTFPEVCVGTKMLTSKAERVQVTFELTATVFRKNQEMPNWLNCRELTASKVFPPAKNIVSLYQETLHDAKVDSITFCVDYSDSRVDQAYTVISQIGLLQILAKSNTDITFTIFSAPCKDESLSCTGLSLHETDLFSLMGKGDSKHGVGGGSTGLENILWRFSEPRTGNHILVYCSDFCDAATHNKTLRKQFKQLQDNGVKILGVNIYHTPVEEFGISVLSKGCGTIDGLTGNYVAEIRRLLGLPVVTGSDSEATGLEAVAKSTKAAAIQGHKNTLNDGITNFMKVKALRIAELTYAELKDIIVIAEAVETGAVTQESPLIEALARRIMEQRQ